MADIAKETANLRKSKNANREPMHPRFALLIAGRGRLAGEIILYFLTFTINTMDDIFLYKDEVYKIVGLAFDVYNELKSGFLEAVYQEAFEQMLISEQIPYVREKEITIYFREKPLKKRYKSDFVVYENILIEFKAHETITAEDEAQVLNYMRGTKLPVAILFNFGNYRKLEWRRYVMSGNNKLIEEDRDPADLPDLDY